MLASRVSLSLRDRHRAHVWCYLDPLRPANGSRFCSRGEAGTRRAVTMASGTDEVGQRDSADRRPPLSQSGCRRGNGAAVAGGWLAAAAGCAERTTRRSGTVTATRSTRLPQPWQRRSEARAAARAEAVVARSVAARLDVGDCDSAPGLPGGRFRASTITCCTGTGRTEGRCDLNHAAVAWPRVAVISSLPAHALLPIVPCESAGERRQVACNARGCDSLVGSPLAAPI